MSELYLELGEEEFMKNEYLDKNPDSWPRHLHLAIQATNLRKMRRKDAAHYRLCIRVDYGNGGPNNECLYTPNGREVGGVLGIPFGAILLKTWGNLVADQKDLDNTDLTEFHGHVFL